MNLIARNKIAEYIAEHPENRIPLLVWLKSYPYLEGKRMFTGGRSVESGSSVPGRGECMILYKINHKAKTVCITWVGSVEKHKEKMNLEFKELEQKNPGLVQTEIIHTTQVIINAPEPEESIQSENFKRPDFHQTQSLHQSESINQLQEEEKSQIDLTQDLSSDPTHDLPEEQVFKTAAEYEQALTRAISIFESQPGTQEFDELLILLPRVKNYEDNQLKFPPLYNFEVIKDKFELLSMIPRDLARIAGSEDEVNLFLSGKLVLSDEILNQLYKHLFIRFPVK